jgi:hypothetical protein
LANKEEVKYKREVPMSKKTFILVLFCVLSAIGLCRITNVIISPLTPTINDIITITTNGWQGSGPVYFTDSIWQIEGSAITLDLYMTAGALTVITNWSYSDDIGKLSAGDYSLIANTIVWYGGTYYAYSTYSTSFTVVNPEPASLLLFGAGIIGLRWARRI